MNDSPIDFETAPLFGMRFGYTRVSTVAQTLHQQHDADPEARTDHTIGVGILSRVVLTQPKQISAFPDNQFPDNQSTFELRKVLCDETSAAASPAFAPHPQDRAEILRPYAGEAVALQDVAEFVFAGQQQCARCPSVQAVLPTKEGHPHWGAPWCGCVVTGAGRLPAAGCQRPTRGGRSRSGC